MDYIDIAEKQQQELLGMGKVYEINVVVARPYFRSTF